MSKFEVLNKEAHSKLHIKRGYSSELGDDVMYMMTYPLEFRDIQNCYPVLFVKNPESGEFFSAAVLGFEPDQNLFLQGNAWDASYIPAAARRQPFLLAAGGEAGTDAPVLTLDLENPRVSDQDGEALFAENGDATEFLNNKIAVLDKLHQGMQHGAGFISALQEHELLEQITMDITFDDGEKKSLQGFYSIAEKRLFELDGAVLESLNKAGYLQPIYMAIASLGRVGDIIQRRNRLHAK